MAAKKSSNKQSIRNTPIGKAYLSARSKMDDDGTPYADLDGRPDTGTYLEPVDSGEDSFVTQWWKQFTNGEGYEDGSWLPEKGYVIIPKELIDNIVIPDTHTVRPGPDFTPDGEGRIPSVIVEPDKSPRKPRKPDSYYDSMRPVRIKPSRPGTLPGEVIPRTM